MRKIDRPSYKIRDVLEILRNEVGNFNETIGTIEGFGSQLHLHQP